MVWQSSRYKIVKVKKLFKKLLKEFWEIFYDNYYYFIFFKIFFQVAGLIVSYLAVIMSMPK